MSKKIKIGLIGLLNKEMKEDFWGTCRKLVEIGFHGLESTNFLLNGDIKEKAKRLRKIGLQPVTVSADKNSLMTEMDKIIDQAKKIGAPHISIWYGPVNSRQQLLEDAKTYNQLGAKIQSAGLKLLYHNHEHEFNIFFDGSCAMDILVEYTDPDKLYFELDCGWITYAGIDPAYILHKMEGRVPAIHMKDLKSRDYQSRSEVVFSAVGTGILRMKDTLKAAKETDVEWVVVEQDRVRNLTAMETVVASYLNIKETGLV